MLELVIFDADGVLFQSDESNIAYYNTIFQAVGEPPLTPEEEKACVFLSAAQVFELRSQGNEERLKRMREISAQLDFEQFFKLLRPPVALRPFLLDLRKSYRLGLATNRSATVQSLLRHFQLTDVFDAVASCADNVRPKPAPDMLTLCLERTGLKQPSKAVYVGDSEIDEAAAKAAGVNFLGVGERVSSARRVGSLTEVPLALRRWFK